VALAISEVRKIVQRACAQQDILDACARRDLGTVITLLRPHGVTQGQISALTGIPRAAERMDDAQAGTARNVDVREVR